MKKILLSTALVVATAGVAAAEVSLSGSGRFGLAYDGSITDKAAFRADPAIVGSSKTSISYRLRVNIDASVESESGVTFGGRIRLQNTEGQTGAALSAAQVFAKYNGMTLQVGNVDTAYDSAALMYDSEVGYIGSSDGNPGGNFFAFSSGPYDAAQSKRVGIFFSYAIDAFNVRVSAVDPDQSVSSDGSLTTNDETEFGISADYTTGQFTVSAAANQNGAGVDGNDQFFLGAAYKFSDAGTVGMNYIDNGDKDNAAGGDDGRTVVLYGNYTFGATTLRAYVANNDGNQGDAALDAIVGPPAFAAVAAGPAAANATDTAFGIGADYDLGGATLSGSVRRGYDKETRGDLGVKFSF